MNLNVAKQKLIWLSENTLTSSFIQLIQINQNDLVQKETSQLIYKDIVQRDQTFVFENKRQQNNKCISLL
jgi:hypothetical protein